MKSLSRIYKYLFLGFPAILYFSYFPLISIGANETMNFELSLALIYLVLFDIVAIALFFEEKKLKELVKYKLWVLYPVFATVSIVWSLNVTRGILTCGVMWALLVAGVSIVTFRKTLLKGTYETLKKVTYGSAVVAILWCLIQCVMDLAGVSRDITLLCAGCTKEMFGFPHPNGFAIEPQFMGNLLLAPTLLSCYEFLKNRKDLWFIIFAFGVFFTFSRGAIYALIIGLAWLMGYKTFKDKNARSLILLPLILFSFLLSLNTQGMMASGSGLGETYNSGVAKVINHLSLGVIDFRNKANEEEPKEESSEKEEAAFDGYVAESTDTRMRLTGAAIDIWNDNAKNLLVGVGAGGAGQALYNNKLSPAPKEIVQNEYASVLLETGIVGAVLFIFTLGMAFYVVWKKSENKIVIVMMVAYSVTLFFFSGYPNALHIYLLPVMFAAVRQQK